MNPLRSYLTVAPTALLSALALVGCGSNLPATIKIGVAQPPSGSSTARGQDRVTGVKLAVAEINASGFKIAGRPVQLEVVTMDDKSDPVGAANYACDATCVLADVLRRVDSLEPAVVRAKLASVDTNAPVTGVMRFGPDGEQRYGAIGVYEKRNGPCEPLIRSDRW